MSKKIPHSWQFSKTETDNYARHGYNTRVKICNVCRCKCLTTATLGGFKTCYILSGIRHELSPDCLIK